VLHNPKEAAFSEEERARIQRAGGFISNHRLCGHTAVTRAIGDNYLKDGAVLRGLGQRADIYSDEIKIPEGGQAIVVRVCDGVTDQGVLDGHGGKFVAKKAAELFPKALQNVINYIPTYHEKLNPIMQ
jgi:serine/threonine protein phosphatase PrpC